MRDLAFDAVIFDMDGVISKTTTVHSAAWKKVLNGFLQNCSTVHDDKFKAFTHNDYLSFFNGKPRSKGLTSFLNSINIELEIGYSSDTPEVETILGLANGKNEAFNALLQRDGIEAYESTERMLKDLKNAGVKLGVASSSKSCVSVLEAVNLLQIFDVRIDGIISEELGLSGKPNPDIFTTTCKKLGTSYNKAIVIEDAVPGVQAAAKGNFGLVLGLARENNEKELAENGADVVLNDLAEVGGISGLNDLFLKFTA